MTKAQWRRLAVRFIEDACVALFGVAGIWLVCTVVGNIFTLLGVC